MRKPKWCIITYIYYTLDSNFLKLSHATCWSFLFSWQVFTLFSPAVMSTSEIPFLVRTSKGYLLCTFFGVKELWYSYLSNFVDKAISSYFEDKPTLWSYDSFLEKLKPLIMEDEDVELSSVWRKRFLTAEINNDNTKDDILQIF